MKKNYLLRLLTLGIYFLPFSFFYSGCEGVAFNKADALKLEKIRISKTKPADSIDFVSDSTISVADTARRINSNEIIDTTSFSYKTNEIAQKIVQHALMPTKESISAIGITQIFTNTFGRVCIIMSIIFSVVLLITERFFRHKNKLIRNLPVPNENTLFVNIRLKKKGLQSNAVDSCLEIGECWQCSFYTRKRRD
jgi:hypothetical protein